MEVENLISLVQFCEHHSIDKDFILSLDDHDIIKVITVNGNSYIHIDAVEKTEKIIRLHIDLSINIEGIDVIIRLLEKIEILENELKKIKGELE
jgi:hypothetical protein